MKALVIKCPCGCGQTLTLSRKEDPMFHILTKVFEKKRKKKKRRV